ncbi:ferredoxin--NADP reductase [[Mycobacterium] wendilense]|uniref:Ferredoxin--NADP reductase n=1 Tax=[Mycobacterium] wendilense TaxID=3064284 RepID=A0ABN9P4Z8_9MYCO|nr:ferredoxin--NADP reductase [Mycolicibacterium sp. MU0050]CAJ1587265.1 ferredoxin--NADP reductase [Mycolicibacterium sp. MU0050]
MPPATRPVDTAAAVTPSSSNGFAPLRVKRVVQETADAVSLIFEVPDGDRERFAYRSGQFVTLRVLIDGHEHQRCYSMSSCPVLEADLQVTVKRDRGGLVSNWLNDNAAVGAEYSVGPPEGRFVLTDTDRELVAFAGGSGITPVISLLRSALTATPRRAGLFYANRGRDSIIFADALAQLETEHPERFSLRHHLDESAGVVSQQHVAEFMRGRGNADVYVCGPGPFMDTVETALLEFGVPRQRIHLERFTAVAAPAPDTNGAVITEEVTIQLDRTTVTQPYRAGNTLLQTARLAGLKAPSSCETGSCGTCMAQVTEGSARMLNNDALDDDEVAEGWVVTCQAIPTSPTVRVVYE